MFSQTPTIGWEAIALGVASWAAVRLTVLNPSAAAAAPALPRADRRLSCDVGRSLCGDISRLLQIVAILRNDHCGATGASGDRTTNGVPWPPGPPFCLPALARLPRLAVGVNAHG